MQSIKEQFKRDKKYQYVKFAISNKGCNSLLGTLTFLAYA